MVPRQHHVWHIDDTRQISVDLNQLQGEHMEDTKLEKADGSIDKRAP